MEEDWEQLADREKANDDLLLAKANVNKWAGEDEDDVKDNWEDDDEEEEKKDESKSETPTKAAKPKKTAQQKLLDKEKLKQLEEQRRREEEEEANMTPEQRAAEKRRLQKLQEENDLKTAMETLGITPMASGGGGTIDGMHPTSKEEFSELAEAISKKLSNYRASTDYQGFLEELLLKLFASVPSADIRKAKNTLDNLYLEKQKVEKGDKPKKTKSSKVKVKLRMEGDNSTLNEYKTNNYDDFDEYDDFM